MARIFGKLKEFMTGEYDEYDEEEYDEYEEDDEEGAASVKENTTLREVKKEKQTQYHSNDKKNSNLYRINPGVKMHIVIMQPACYEDAQKICDYIKEEKPVVINLERVEYTVAQRIMDFLSGTCYSLEGSIQKVANNIFVIAPENVEISSELKEEIKNRNNMAFPWASNA